MAYKILNKKELTSTVYYELLAGTFSGKYWDEDSIYLDEDSFELIKDILFKNHSDFDANGVTEFNELQTLSVLSDLNKRLDDLQKIDPDQNYTAIFPGLQQLDSRMEIEDLLNLFSELISLLKDDFKKGFCVLGL